jgi:uncharacterized repeat protein (TIGR03837 family)
VCWRLARQLAAEHGCEMHLWIDDWHAARTLIGAALPYPPEPAVIESVMLHPWPHTGTPGDLLGDVLIEVFACRLPEPVLAQLRSRANKPLWINLEYFSAEPWVATHHGGSGPDPDGGPGARRWFFIPGLGPDSGGVIRERALFEMRDAYVRTRLDGSPNKKQAESPIPPQSGGIGDSAHEVCLANRPGEQASPLRVLCFAYAHAPYSALLRALAARGPAQLTLCGRYSQQAIDTVALAPYPTLSAVRPGFVPQPEFDRMLWSADCVFVRGEDSLIRALWSGKPMLWQIYPQDAQAHHVKLDAWLARYCEGWPDDLRAAYIGAHMAWNGIADAALFEPAWARLITDLPRWRVLSRARSDAWAREPDLAARLMAFVRATSQA